MVKKQNMIQIVETFQQKTESETTKIPQGKSKQKERDSVSTERRCRSVSAGLPASFNLHDVLLYAFSTTFSCLSRCFVCLFVLQPTLYSCYQCVEEQDGHIGCSTGQAKMQVRPNSLSLHMYYSVVQEKTTYESQLSSQITTLRVFLLLKGIHLCQYIKKNFG